MTEIRDYIELVLRLQELRAAPPAPLHLTRQRDGPREGKPSARRVSRHSAPQNAPERHPSGIDYRSKKVKP